MAMERRLLGLLLVAFLVSWSTIVDQPSVLAAPLPTPQQPTPSLQSAPCAVAVANALSKKGAGYVWGSKGPNTFDCSGLTYWAYKQAGINIGVSTYDQAYAGVAVSCTLSHLAGASSTCWVPGDLIFLAYSGGQHVAIYVGSGLFMDCYNQNSGCILHAVQNDSFYQAHFWQARRIISGCEGQTINPGTPTTTNPLDPPGLESIADMFGYVSFDTPSCDGCTADSIDWAAEAEPVVTWSDPLSPFYWIGWKIGDALRDLVCFLLNLLQLLANVLAAAFNALLFALNQFWKLAIYIWLQFRGAVYIAWAAFGQLLSLTQQLLPLLQYLLTWLQIIFDLMLAALALVGQMLALLGQLVLSVLGLIGWIGGLALGLITSILLALSGTTAPAVLTTNNHPIYGFTRGTLEGFLDSPLKWLIYLLWGMAYVAFVAWLARFLSASSAGGE